jgi:hypothetical protein
MKQRYSVRRGWDRVIISCPDMICGIQVLVGYTAWAGMDIVYSINSIGQRAQAEILEA